MQSLEEIYKKGFATSGPEKTLTKTTKTKQLLLLTSSFIWQVVAKFPHHNQMQREALAIPQSSAESQRAHLPVVWQYKQGPD